MIGQNHIAMKRTAPGPGDSWRTSQRQPHSEQAAVKRKSKCVEGEINDDDVSSASAIVRKKWGAN